MIPKIFISSFSGLIALSVLLSPIYRADASTEMSQADSLTMSRRHLSFGNNYFKNDQLEDAETQFLRAWNFNPGNAQTARFLGRLYNRLENYEEAIRWYQEAIDLAPQANQTKIPYLDLASIYVMQQNDEGAIACYEALLDFPLPPEEEIRYLHNLVSLYVNAQDLEQALEYARRWGELAPDDPDVRSMIGNLYQHTGGEDEALVELEKVIEMNPDDHATREKIADMYQTRGDLEKAFEAFEILYQNDPKNFYFLEKTFSLGKSLNRPNRFLINRLHRMHALQPQNLSVIEELAELTEDVKWIRLGLQRDAGNGKYPYMMGEHFFDKWQNTKAPQDSLQALNWFKKAQKDPAWAGNATAMVLTLDPPLSEEEKMRRKFFEDSRARQQETVQDEGRR